VVLNRNHAKQYYSTKVKSNRRSMSFEPSSPTEEIFSTPQSAAGEPPEDQHPAEASRSYIDHSLSAPTTSETASANQELQRFPERLYQLLERAEQEHFSHVISWQPHGRCFMIHQRDAFKNLLSVLMPGMLRWKSFQRQLRRWGFLRLVEGRDCNGYYHENFLRYRRHLLCHMRCAWYGSHTVESANPAASPNFYLMPFLAPLQPHSSEEMTSAAVIATQDRSDPATSQLLDQHVTICMSGRGRYRHTDMIRQSERSNRSTTGASLAFLPATNAATEGRFSDEPLAHFPQPGAETQAIGGYDLQRGISESLRDSFLHSGVQLMPSNDPTVFYRDFEPRPLPPVVTRMDERLMFSYTPIPVAQHPGFLQIGPQEFSFNSNLLVDMSEPTEDENGRESWNTGNEDGT
jgi:HSF-type DNA-binding